MFPSAAKFAAVGLANVTAPELFGRQDKAVACGQPAEFTDGSGRMIAPPVCGMVDPPLAPCPALPDWAGLGVGEFGFVGFVWLIWKLPKRNANPNANSKAWRGKEPSTGTSAPRSFTPPPTTAATMQTIPATKRLPDTVPPLDIRRSIGDTTSGTSPEVEKVRGENT